MFLHELTDNGYYRTLFLECVYILLVAGRSDDFFEITNDFWDEKNYKAKFLKNDNFFKIVSEYSKDFDQSINEKNYSKFLEEGIMSDFDGVYKIDKKSTHIDHFGGHSSSIFEYSHMTFEESIRNSAEESCFPYLFSIFGYFMQQEIGQINDNVEDKATTIGQLLRDQSDSSNSSNKDVYKEKLLLPDVKIEILNNVLDLIFAMKSEYLLDGSKKDKKIIIFELIKCCFDYSKFGEIEKSIISKICKNLKVDMEYIEEFEDIVNQLLIVSKEAKELINE